MVLYPKQIRLPVLKCIPEVRLKTSIQKWGNSLAVIKPDAGPDRRDGFKGQRAVA
jgi:hypothetical protein